MVVNITFFVLFCFFLLFFVLFCFFVFVLFLFVCLFLFLFLFYINGNSQGILIWFHLCRKYQRESQHKAKPKNACLGYYCSMLLQCILYSPFRWIDTEKLVCRMDAVPNRIRRMFLWVFHRYTNICPMTPFLFVSVTRPPESEFNTSWVGMYSPGYS